MAKTTAWKCDVCGYIHQGDAPPDTCPVCGVGPELFSPFEEPSEEPEAPAASAWRCTICDYVHEGEAPPEVCPVCGAPASLFRPMEEVEPVADSDLARARVVILGAGVAGVTAAQQARQAAPEAEIAVVTKEAGPPYYRLSLTPYLAGQVADEELQLKPLSWFEEQRIERVEGEVVAIDRQAQVVSLIDGRTLPYDRLVLANGAHPFVPPVPGVTREGVKTLRTLADSREVLQRAEKARACVCIGGGLLGLEAAAALARRLSLSVTVLEGFGWLLPRQLARPAARRLKRDLESTGLTIRTGAVVKELLGDEAVAGVRLEGGEEIPADLVLISTGVRPNSYLARRARLEVKGGVVVDEKLRTSDPKILAAGDVAEHNGLVYGLWSAAFAQGRVAGNNAVGADSSYAAPPPSTRLKVADLDIFSIGRFEPDDGSFNVFEEENDRAYVRLVCRDGKLVGANLYGDTTLAGAITRAVEQGTQLRELSELLKRFPGLASCCNVS